MSTVAENFSNYKSEFLRLAINDAERNGIEFHWFRFMDTIKFLEKNQPLSGSYKVLDIGLGSGWLSILLKQAYGWDVSGIDIPREETAQWKQRYEKYGIEFKLCDLTKEKIPFEDNTFDFVFFTEVLEHLITEHPPYAILKNINGVLKKNGQLILTTPNFVAFHKRVLVFLGINPYSYGYGGLDGNVPSADRHIREYTLSELKYVLRACNFSVEQVRRKNYYFLRRIHEPISSLIPSLRDAMVLKCRKL